MTDLRVLVVSHDPLARAGLAALLDQQPGCNVVGRVADDEVKSPSLEVYKPDVLVWDLGWNSVPGLERMGEITEGITGDAPPVLALVADQSQADEARIAGARGVLLRETDAGVMVPALFATARGLVVLDPSLAARATTPRSSDPVPDLTPRERQALSLLGEGLPNKTIASRMGISEHTVKFHVNSILGKLGAQSRTEAVTRATRLGLILL